MIILNLYLCEKTCKFKNPSTKLLIPPLPLPSSFSAFDGLVRSGWSTSANPLASCENDAIVDVTPSWTSQRKKNPKFYVISSHTAYIKPFHLINITKGQIRIISI